MSILSQVDDARFLRNNGRHLGALTTLMLAVAASARRVFPRGTSSIITPPSKKGKVISMGDAESFELFLGGRLRKVTSIAMPGTPETGKSNIIMPYNGEHSSLEHLLYKFYRCALVHEGQLEEDVEFVEVNPVRSGVVITNVANPRNQYITPGVYSASISIRKENNQDRLALTYGWLDILLQAVTEADINDDIFHLRIPDLLPIQQGFDEDAFRLQLYSLLQLEPYPDGTLPYSSFFNIMKLIIREMKPDHINGAPDKQIRQRFQQAKNQLHAAAGAFTGLAGDGLLDDNWNLTDKGLLILKQIATQYEIR